MTDTILMLAGKSENTECDDVSAAGMSRIVPVRSRRARMPFSAVCKPSGAACNINCAYCFFLSKDLLFDEKSQRMSDDILEQYIREYLAAQPDGPVEMPWQGGEPTLRGVEFFEKVVRLVRRYARPKQRVHQSIQTNATLIDERWCRFLKDNGFLVGVSIDGPAEIHNRYRVNKAGRGTFDLTRRGWEQLQAAGIETCLLCTVNSNNSQYPLEVYRFFRDDLKADYIQFIPIVERVPRHYRREAENGWITTGGERILYQQRGDDVTSRTVSPEAYGEFMVTIFDEWVRHDVGRVSVQQFDSMMGNYLGRPSLCVHAPVCGDAPAVLHNGDVYSCDHFVEPGYRIGNIAEQGFADMMESGRQRAFGRTKRDMLPQRCVTCPMLWACNGGCPKDRFVPVTMDDDGAPVDCDEGAAEIVGRSDNSIDPHPINYLCRGFYRFFSHAAPAIEQMARGVVYGRSPESIAWDMREVLCLV